jgi:hypothetical protein
VVRTGDFGYALTREDPPERPQIDDEHGATDHGKRQQKHCLECGKGPERIVDAGALRELDDRFLTGA